MTTEE